MPEAAIAEKTVEAHRIRVLRYRPASDAEPSFGSFEVPYTDDMSVLQALQTIKDTLDGSSASAGRAAWPSAEAAG